MNLYILRKKIIFLIITVLSVIKLWGVDDTQNKVLFSHTGGFYTNIFTLTIEVPDNSYDILYTIDGSNPQISATAINGGKTKSIVINPGSTTDRAKTPGFIVRASLTKTGEETTKPVTQTYIFPAEVIKQKHPGGNWPNHNVNGQLIILGLSDKVTGDAHYRNQMVDALLDIPSISIVSDLESLFHPDSGIYVNAWAHGIEWERYCNVELLDPKKGQQFSIGAGLRIRGGWSRHNDFPKHSFRLFFRGVYGETKLRYPLFDDEGVDEFDKIDLRTAQNYAWSNGQSRNTFVREVFSRDSQRDMGVPYTRSRYYHLYINGMYWGLFQTQERSEARYAESYLGGERDDYDVVKVNTDNWNYKVGATDGTTENWERVWEMCQKGFSSNEKYFNIEGRNANGELKPGAEKLVDIDNLIDYMLTIFYTGNFDAPMSQFGGNRHANNFYTIYNRNDKTKGFVFFNHDAEHSLMTDAVSPGKGLYENRVEPQGMHVESFIDFHPQWLHHKLSENAEYRQRFSDRAYKHLFNNGVLTPHQSTQRFEGRADQIDKAIIAESARWGAAKTSRAFTRDKDWLPEIEYVINSFFPYRTGIVIDQLADAGLLNNIKPPMLSINDKPVSEKRFLYGDTDVKITSENSNGQIYITYNGTDPRSVGGGISPHAKEFKNGETITLKTTTHIKGRIKRGNEWSPLNNVIFIKQLENYENLKITELHYQPSDSIVGNDTISEKEFEFIEFKNTGKHAIDLTRLRFISGIEYRFPNDAVLQPDMFYVLAGNSQWFFERYGRAPSDIYRKAFSNEGEILTIMSDIGKAVAGFEYFPSDPWPTGTSGTGYSLSSADINPTGNPNDPSYWKTSSYLNGSPFFNDNGHPLRIENKTDPRLLTSIYPNPTNGTLHINPGNNKPLKIEIFTHTGQQVYSKTLYEYLSIDLSQMNINPGLFLIKTSHSGKTSIKKIIYYN
jgi:hypothetical protein